MTIKELEALSEMERANVRFYEREGLITPARMKNGYRDYSEDDLQILLRVKLLRGLHMPLDEIKSLKAGSSDLSEALSKQIEKLEIESQDAAFARDICSAIKEEKVDFATLDAAKYLENIDRAIVKSGSPYFTAAGDVLPQVHKPWRRYFARTLDTAVYNLLWTVFLVVAFQINFTIRSAWGNLLDIFASVIIMLFVEPLLLHLFGTTLGKLVLGLRVEGDDGRYLSYSEGFERTWGVIGSGLGYSIPFYNLRRLWVSYIACREKETLPWDSEISYYSKGRKWYQIVSYIGAYAVIFAFAFSIYHAQLLPPNRGNITIAQFAENYNYYAKFFDVDLGNKYLDEEAKWAEREYDGTFYFELGYSEKPVFNFELEDGFIKSVAFQIEVQNNTNLIEAYNAQMQLSSLAFACAQKEVKLFSRAPFHITEQINRQFFQSFRFSESNITFACDTEYSGYESSESGYLWPEEGLAENHFSLTFIVSK